MKTKCLFYLICSLCLFGCSQEPRFRPRYSEQLNKIIEETAIDLRNEFGFHLFLKGGGGVSNLNIVCVGFNLNQEADISRARELMIYSIDTLLNNINKNKKVRVFLSEYPFTSNKIELGISLKKNLNYVNPPYVAYVSILNGKLYYRLYDPKQDKLVDLHMETYEEALAMVQGNGD